MPDTQRQPVTRYCSPQYVSRQRSGICKQLKIMLPCSRARRILSYCAGSKFVKTKWLLVRQEARTQSGRGRLGSVTLAKSKVRVRAGYEFVSCRHHRDRRLPVGPQRLKKSPRPHIEGIVSFPDPGCPSALNGT